MPVRLFIWPPAEGAEIPKDYVGVFIERWGEEGIHAGIIYRTTQGGTWILHHQGHFDLQHGQPKAGQIVVICPIDPLEVSILSRFFLNLYRRNKRKGIPYGFNSADMQWFSDDGTFIKPEGALGICCQTFVLAAYSAADTQLIAPLDPAPRADDAARQIALLNSFNPLLGTAKPVTQEHFAAVRASVGISLTRPLEVGGAALADALPSAFDEAVHRSAKIDLLLVRPAI